MKRSTTSSVTARPRVRRSALFGAAAIAATVPLVLGGCSAGGSADTGSVKSISVLDYYNQGTDKQVIGDTLNQCGKDVGVTIKRTMVPGANLVQKVLQQASSKTLPDVLMLDNPDLQQIASSGALAPLTDYGISSKGYAKGVVSAGTYKDELYGLAPTVNTIALVYDKKALSDAGVEVPTTWDELQAAAKKLTSGDKYGLAFDANATYEGTWQFLPFMWSNGGDEKDIADKGTVGALQYWTDLVNDGSVSKSALNWTQADVNDQFMAGKAAMMINGPWQIPAMKQNGIDYGIAKIPVPKAGDDSVAPLGGEVWTVPQTGDKAKMTVAAKVVKCMNSDANQLQMAKKRYTIPAKTSVAEQFAKDVPEEAVFADMVSTARARTGELGDKWPDTATKIYTAVQAALTGQSSPADALKSAAGN